MKKNLLKKTVPFLVSAVVLSQATTVSHASWGAQRLLQQQQQNPVATTAPAQPSRIQPRQNPAPSTPAQTNNNQSTASFIRNLRTNQGAPQNNNVNNNITQPSSPTTQPTTPVNNETSLASMESAMLQLINSERSKHGLAPLQWHANLGEVAKSKSLDMIQNNYFAHNSPTYGSFQQMISNAGISFNHAGENLAKAGDVQRAHMLLMASEGHRNNLLNPSFTHIGLGISTDTYGIVVTQLFIRQ